LIFDNKRLLLADEIMEVLIIFRVQKSPNFNGL